MKSATSYKIGDTIAAIATFPSPSALGVIKISGPAALSIVDKLFVPVRKKNIKNAPSFTIHYGWIVRYSKQHASQRSRIDEVLVSIMRAPRSYTREDVVEISCHGGVVVLNEILAEIKNAGARLAEPGEFSYRAFINGRIDLIQAQAIIDIVEAKTQQALFSFSQQLSGAFSEYIRQLKETIKTYSVSLSASINFPDEEITFDSGKLAADLHKVCDDIGSFLDNAATAKILRDGIRCVICGKANVGKSTIFNRFLKEERVIVTHIAGTTRDIIEETIQIRGLPLVICDTAGILEPKDFIDRVSVAKTYAKIEEADIILFICDNSSVLTGKDKQLLEKIRKKNIIIVVNKTDLANRLDVAALKKFKKPIVMMSALKEKGLGKLESTIVKNVYSKGVDSRRNIVLLAEWQRSTLCEVQKSLQEAVQAIGEARPVDFVHLALLDVLRYLGRLTGETVDGELLDAVFSRFCIGK